MNTKRKSFLSRSKRPSAPPPNRRNAPPPNRRNAPPPNRKKKGSGSKTSSQKKEKETSKGPRKSLRALLRVLATICVTVATLWAGLATYQHTTTSPYFAISEIVISGLGRLTKEELLNTAGFKEGTNIFRFDVEMARRKLVNHPWIETAMVKRQLPRNLVIDVSERKSVAVVILDVPYLVDETGEVFKRWAKGDPIPAPVISGISREEFIEDPDRIQAKIRDAIHLAKRYRQVGLERKAPLAEIHCEVNGGFSFATKNDPFYVRFGLGPYRGKLSRLKLLLSRLSRDGKRPAMIFFDNKVRPDRVTVKLKSSASRREDRAKSSMKTSAAEKSVSKI